MKIDAYYYLIVLMFHLFPSYSLSVLVSSIFIQPRFFAFPFLLINVGKVKIDRGIIVILLLLLISAFVPIIGLLFERSLSLLDAALILNWLYLLLFYHATVKNIDIFNKFIKLFLWINLIYIAIQLIFYYAGLPELTMVHSNVPFHVESGYTIEPSVLDWLPRYTGLFIESGPLTLFLCCTFLYLVQNKEKFSKSLIFFIGLCIVFSQSKFEIVFIPMILLEGYISTRYASVYEKLVSPKLFIAYSATIILSIYVVFTATQLNESLVAVLPAYEQRLDAIQESLENLHAVKIFGNIYQGSNYDASNGQIDLQKWDIFSILFFGYGVVAGALMLLLILSVPIILNIKFKFTTLALLILALLSSGSLLIPQYTFFIVYCLLIHNRECSYEEHAGSTEKGVPA